MSDDEVRAYRAWLRTHHPDVGGDRDAFEAGLRAWHARLARHRPHASGPPSAPVTCYRAPRGPIAAIAWRLTRRRARRERRLRLR
ncbi:MAG TPA: hypothetical protein VGL93_26140 [Streptosporangiaceae bacterium]|jgi:hypothetical protein